MISDVFTTLCAVVIGTAFIGGVSLRTATTQWQKVFLVGIIAGLFIYSGAGAAYPEVPIYYLFFYFGFLVAFVTTFKFFSILFSGLSRRAGWKVPEVLIGVDRSLIWLWIILCYLLLDIVPLVYPEFRLHVLLAPQMPDIATWFAKQFDYQEANIFLKLVNYLSLLLTPFFFVALYRYRNRVYSIVILLLALMYIEYVDKVYIGRGKVLMTLMMIVIILWISRPQLRRILTLVGVIFLPFFLVAFHYYGQIRLGRQLDIVGFLDSIESVIYSETSFPVVSGMPLIESGAQVDLGSYLIWIATLPIPKIVTGEIAGARITYEISEIVLGGNRGDHGWFVILPGLVAESVYIFGKYFFWLHGVTLAFVTALVVSLIERTPQFLVLNSYLAVILAYAMNRAGIGSILPEIVNSFLLFYLFIFVSIIRHSSSKRASWQMRR